MIADAVARLTEEIATRSADLGRRVVLDPVGVLDRSDSVALSAPGRVSANGGCRLFAATDGWLALNLARPEDHALLPAWLGSGLDAGDLEAVAQKVSKQPLAELIEQGCTVSLPLAAVGEVADGDLQPPTVRLRGGGQAPARLRVLDLSALWAGPLCAAVFTAMGADTLRLESVDRPEARTSPHYRRLNAGKSVEAIAWRSQAGVLRLQTEIAGADVIVTSARRRAFSQLSFDPFALLKANAVWVAVSGFGWRGAQADRVAFGDDAAAAAGLVDWGADGAPRFTGDALADPITGLAAAAAALRAVSAGGGVLIDAALAYCAAGARKSGLGRQ